MIKEETLGDFFFSAQVHTASKWKSQSSNSGSRAPQFVLVTTGSAFICNYCVVTVSLVSTLIKAKFPWNMSAISAEQCVLLLQHTAASWSCLPVNPFTVLPESSLLPPTDPSTPRPGLTNSPFLLAFMQPEFSPLCLTGVSVVSQCHESLH